MKQFVGTRGSRSYIISIIILFGMMMHQLYVPGLVVAKKYETTAKVVKVIDGDTCLVDIPDYGHATVRTWGIDCPERKQPMGNQSTEFFASLIWDKPLRLVVRSKDQYGRLVAQIFHENVDVGLTMVRYGYAWHYVSITKNKSLAKAQSEAKRQELGIWISPNPTPPWVFRKTPKAQ